MSWLFLLMIFLLASGLLFRTTLKSFFFSPKTEGRKMSGRHRAENYDDLRALENLEPWRITHHLYQTRSFDSADDVAAFLASNDLPGRRREWKVLAPHTARWQGGLKEAISGEEFMDFYLDSLLKKLRS